MKTVILKLTSAIVVAGQVIRAGHLVEVTEGEAKDLLHRGKATLATAADGAEPAAPTAVTNGEDPEPHPEVEAANAALAPEGGAEAPAPAPKSGKRRK